MIVFLGDIHGNFFGLKKMIIRKGISDCTLIQVGDFGIGFRKLEEDKSDLEDLNSFFSKKGINFLAIRGNHDDPKFFEGDYKYSNLELLPDYTQRQIEDYNLLFIGGATSVDRRKRIISDRTVSLLGINSKTYWANEILKWNDSIDAIEGVDILVTHTAPTWCDPIQISHFVNSYAQVDDNLVEDLKNERELMNNIFNKLLEKNYITKHFYGHFHNSSVTSTESCYHRLLNIDEFFELR